MGDEYKNENNEAAEIRPTGPTGPQYTRIARHGEPEYAAIIRNRSGQDAGGIDFGCKVTLIEAMPPAEKREIVLTAAGLLRSVEEAAGVTLAEIRREQAKAGRPGGAERTPIGIRITDLIISGGLMRMSCPDAPDSGCVAVWSAAAHEQIESLVAEYPRDGDLDHLR